MNLKGEETSLNRVSPLFLSIDQFSLSYSWLKTLNFIFLLFSPLVVEDYDRIPVNRLKAPDVSKGY